MIVTRNNEPIRGIISMARQLGEECFESHFGREMYCAMFNEPSVPENQVFICSHAKPSQIILMRGYDLGKDEKRVHLCHLMMTSWPKEIATFRFEPTAGSPGEVFITDCSGQTGPSRPFEYYNAWSLRTFIEKCWEDGGVWCGGLALIKPFVEFCRIQGDHD
jgi:hypothetical protein